MLALIDRFKACYASFGPNSLAQLDAIYSKQAIFVDPIHKVAGISNIQNYFADMCQNLVSCRFTYHHQAVQGDDVFIQWAMHYQHKSLAGGKPITVHGVSRLKVQNDRVVEHEDFYDMGAMVYEQIPLLGRLIVWLRSRLATAQTVNQARLSSTAR